MFNFGVWNLHGPVGNFGWFLDNMAGRFGDSGLSRDNIPVRAVDSHCRIERVAGHEVNWPGGPSNLAVRFSKLNRRFRNVADLFGNLPVGVFQCSWRFFSYFVTETEGRCHLPKNGFPEFPV